MARAVRTYLADELAESFADPKLLAGDVPPELWKYRDGAEGLYASKQPRELLAYLQGPLARHPDDQALIAFHALTLIETGKDGSALSALAGLCKRNHDACEPLLAAAQKLLDRGKKDLAGKFIDMALSVRPDWPDGLMARATLRFQQAQYGDALADYGKVLDRLDSLALQWRIADCYYFLGRQGDAIVHYKRGLAFWHEMMGNADLAGVAGARDRMLELARIKKDASLAEAIRRVFGPASPDRT